MQLSAARQAYVPLQDLPVTVHTLRSGDSCLISKGLDGGRGEVGWGVRLVCEVYRRGRVEDWEQEIGGPECTPALNGTA